MSTHTHITPAEAMPTTSRGFVWHYTRLFLGWSLLMIGLEFGAALCTTLIPYAIGKITGAVREGCRHSFRQHAGAAVDGVPRRGRDAAFT